MTLPSTRRGLGESEATFPAGAHTYNSVWGSVSWKQRNWWLCSSSSCIFLTNRWPNGAMTRSSFVSNRHPFWHILAPCFIAFRTSTAKGLSSISKRCSWQLVMASRCCSCWPNKACAKAPHVKTPFNTQLPPILPNPLVVTILKFVVFSFFPKHFFLITSPLAVPFSSTTSLSSLTIHVMFSTQNNHNLLSNSCFCLILLASYFCKISVVLSRISNA